MAEQLPLNVGLKDMNTLETFYPGENALALTHVGHMATYQTKENFLYLWGRVGVGCTHLLQGACHLAEISGFTAFYGSLATMCAYSPTTLNGLEQIDVVCLDEIHRIAGKPNWEEAVFHLFNELKAGGKKLLVAANAAPKGIGLQLPDLQSRFGWGMTLQLHPLNDEDRLKALQLRAKTRGLQLPDEVGQFLLARCSRDMHALHEVLEKLDVASLVNQRRLTIPFIKSTLNL